MSPLNTVTHGSGHCACFQESFSLIVAFIWSSLLPYFYFLSFCWGRAGEEGSVSICWIVFAFLLYPSLSLKSF